MNWNIIDIGTYLTVSHAFLALVFGFLVPSMLAFISIGMIFDSWEWKYHKDDKADNTKERLIIKRTVISILIFSISCGLVALCPTHEIMLKVKIAKIKNELVTDKNLNATAETLERIAERLECKYLGCDKETKK